MSHKAAHCCAAAGNFGRPEMAESVVLLTHYPTTSPTTRRKFFSEDLFKITFGISPFQPTDAA
jgi:hypothetical protein